ncbi:hypothetical protein ACQKWADRAFT_288090 [Trichoderma austrokoningii]
MWCRQPYSLIYLAVRPFASTSSGNLPQFGYIYRAPSTSYKHHRALFPAASHRLLLLSPFSSRSQPPAHDSNPAMDLSNNNHNLMPVPWGRLKAWITAQEQAEQNGYNPNPPTKTQIAALSHIVDFLDEPEPTAEIIGKKDHVSELMLFTSSKSLAPPKFEDLAPIEIPINGVLSQRWRTVCILPFANNKEFPCLGYGLDDERKPLLWKSKKLSKQYAAKYAFLYVKDYLRASSTTSNRASATASNDSAPKATAAPPPLASHSTPSNGNGNNNASLGSNTSANAQTPLGGAPESASASSMLPSPSSSTGDLTTSVEDTDFYDRPNLPSLLDQVKNETAYLKLGSPHFEIWPDPETPRAFAGKPVFKNSGRVPQDMGHIKGALTKGLAKELIAEEILKYCKAERKRKETLLNSFKPSAEE